MCAVSAFGLATAAPANAANLFASGNGVGGTCTVSAPPTAACSLSSAIAAADNAGDDITLLTGGGNFNLGASTLTIPGTIVVHGTPGARATLLSTATNAVVLGAGAILRDVNITHTTGTGKSLDFGANTLAERVFVAATDFNPFFVCNVESPGVVIRDSICWSKTQSGAAIRVVASGGFTSSLTLRNVTAVDTFNQGSGIRVSASGASSAATVSATNVIARGASLYDVEASADNVTPAPHATVTLDHSNYDVVTPGQNSSITAAGSGTNVTTGPVFADEANGNFTQLASSSGTVDRGTVDTLNGLGVGSLALDGQPRCLGTAPDIGADEFTAAACPPPPLPGPAAAIAAAKKCPKGKKLKKVHGKKKCVKKKKKRR